MHFSLQTISTFDELIRYLEAELDWPMEEFEYDDLVFEYEPEELGLKKEDAAKVNAVHQLRPLQDHMPWGVFFVEFERKKLPVLLMRRILRSLVIKKRDSANSAERAAWKPNDLLFITAIGEEENRNITFAHFLEQPGSGLAELRVLGWDDDDTLLHMRQVEGTLKTHLKWCDDLTGDPAAWRDEWSKAFVVRYRHSISQSSELAEALAVTAKRLRNRLREILYYEDEIGEIRNLQKALKETLIHDLDDDGFADMFAQTVTYGLFSLACHRAVSGMGTAFIKEDLMHYFTSPFLRDILGIFLGLNSKNGGIDFDEMGVSDVTDLLSSPETHMEIILADFNNKTQREDPVIYFYEYFLAAYDNTQKVLRGEFYTPQPVVSYITHSVHELLQSVFGIKDGLASTVTWGEMIKQNPDIQLPPLTDDPGERKNISPDEFFVQILDPATGTATFLVEVIDIVFKHLTNKWESEGLDESERNKAWNKYVPKYLLPRLFGYELKMAPYAIAHMKIGLKLSETGYSFDTVEPTNIYLTNTLEPMSERFPSIEFEALVNEAVAVNAAKLHKRFTVVMGNPPYSVSSQNKGEYIEDLMALYKKAVKDERNIQPLSDDYLKFIRLSHKILDTTGIGLMGLITNNSFLSGLIHRGVREELLKYFERAFVLDLHGNSVLSERDDNGERDENVFDIRQGVSIILLSKDGNLDVPETLHADIIGGKNKKCRKLMSSNFCKIKGQKLTPVSPGFFFVPKCQDQKDEYERGWKIDDIFPVNISGIKTHRDSFVLDFKKPKLEERIMEFRDNSVDDNYFREAYGLKERAGGWNICSARSAVQQDKSWKSKFQKCLYRPFDIRHLYYSKDLIDRPRANVMDHMVQLKDNMALLAMRQVATGDEYSHFGVTRWVVDNRTFFSNKGIVNLFPLYLRDTSTNSESSKPNFSSGFSSAIQKLMNVSLLDHGSGDMLNNVGPADIFNYIYSIFHSKDYRVRYDHLLRDDFPRIPFTKDINFFRELSKLGAQIISLHTLEYFQEGGKSAVVFPVNGSNCVDTVSFVEDEGDPHSSRVYINREQYFEGIHTDIWGTKIGGYQVCEKWLKDRRNCTLLGEDIEMYHAIVSSIILADQKMDMIDDTILSYGGWQDAFSEFFT